MKYLVYVLVISGFFFPIILQTMETPPTPAIEPSTSGSSGENVAVTPIRPEKSPRLVTQRRTFFEGKGSKPTAIGKKDSVVDVAELGINRVKGRDRRGSVIMAAKAAYLKTLQASQLSQEIPKDKSS